MKSWLTTITLAFLAFNFEAIAEGAEHTSCKDYLIGRARKVHTAIEKTAAVWKRQGYDAKTANTIAAFQATHDEGFANLSWTELPLALGIHPGLLERWRQTFRHDADYFGKKPASLYEAWLYNQALILEPTVDAQMSLQRNKRKVNFFPARAQFLPMDFFSPRGFQREGIPERALHFALFVDPRFISADVAWPEELKNPNSPHVPGAFAYLRAYDSLVSDTIYVTEVQSDVYKYIRKDPILKERYQDWPTVLLLAFEHFVHQFGFNKIIVVGPDYIKRRWNSPPSGGLRSILYKRVPLQLGYTPIHGLDFPFESVKLPEPQKDLFPVLIQDGYKFDLSTPVNNLDRIHFNEAMHPQLQELASLVRASPMFFDGQTQIRQEQPKKIAYGIDVEGQPFLHAQGRWVSYAELWGYNPQKLAQLHARVLEKALSGTEQFPYSSHDLWLNVDYLVNHAVGPFKFFHFKRQSRHPFFQGDGWSMGVKGAGSHSELDPNFTDRGYHLQTIQKDGKNLEKWKFPFQRTRIRQEEGNDIQPEHLGQRFWGALELMDAKTEFVKQLGLHQLMMDVDEGHLANAPVPLDILELDQIPIRHQDPTYETKQISVTQYVVGVLGAPNLELAILRTVAKSHLRIPSFHELFLNTFDLEGALELIYRVNGEIYQKSDAPFVFSGIPSIFAFLQQAYLRNQATADRILDRIITQSLKTMAAVHGARGHLGGSQRQVYESVKPGDYFNEDATSIIEEIEKSHGKVGAHLGGGPAPRNFSITGEFFDIDEDVYFPWVTGSIKKHDVELQRFQRDDLVYWDNSIFWMKAILKGFEVDEGEMIPEHPLGNPQDGLMVIDFKYIKHGLLKDHGRRLECPFNDSKLNDLYSDYYRRGKRFSDTPDSLRVY